MNKYGYIATEHFWESFYREDYNHIIGNIYMGGVPESMPDKMFQSILNLYVWEPYPTHKGVDMLMYTMYDSAEIPDEQELHNLAEWVNARAESAPVLVHCQAGLNRSGLVTALALIKRGFAPSDAISLIRKKRSPAALCNNVFVEWLMGQGS